MKRGEKHAKGQKVKVLWWVAHLTFSSEAGAFCFLEAMFGNLAVLIEFYFFPFVLINSHNKMNRRSVLRQLPNTLCKVWAIKVSLTGGTLLGVTDKVRISGSASHILTRFKDEPNLNDYRRHFWHNKSDGKGLQANVQTTGSLIREDLSSAKRSSLDFVLSVLVYLAV